MRSGLLVAGVILLIVGIFLYSTGNNTIKGVERATHETDPTIEILKIVSPDIRKDINHRIETHYTNGQSLMMFGSIFGIVGFILCIAGIAAPSKTKENSPKKIKKSVAECEMCGHLFDTAILQLGTVNGKELLLCKTCRNKFSDKTSNAELKTDNKDPVEILKLRYARGEVTREEYGQIIKDIGGDQT